MSKKMSKKKTIFNCNAGIGTVYWCPKDADRNWQISVGNWTLEQQIRQCWWPAVQDQQQHKPTESTAPYSGNLKYGKI